MINIVLYCQGKFLTVRVCMPTIPVPVLYLYSPLDVCSSHYDLNYPVPCDRVASRYLCEQREQFGMSPSHYGEESYLSLVFQSFGRDLDSATTEFRFI